MGVVYYATVKCDFCGYTQYYDESDRREELPSRRVILMKKQRVGWKFKAGKCMCPDCIRKGISWDER